MACGLAFITPLPPDPGALLDGRGRLTGMALLMCCCWGKWLLMKGLKWRVDHTSPGANALAPQCAHLLGAWLLGPAYAWVQDLSCVGSLASKPRHCIVLFLSSS